MITILLATLSSCFLYFYKKFRPTPRPPFTTVRKNQRHMLSNKEQQLYDLLTREGYYVSCRFPYGYLILPMALIPFRYAIFPKVSKIKTIIISFYLSLKGWNVVFISESGGKEGYEDEIQKLKGLLEKGIVTNKGQGA